ncbi:MAG: phage head-tail connector protein [Ruminococcus flavefaciens]|nr:phage head-tail connector protein [Eubacterium sp.]MCM1236708.1 phage head-tail connector protein [Ruminococcus flavefaciens]
MIHKEEMLYKIKLRLGLKGEDTEHDEVLRLMLEDAVMVIMVFCNRDVFPVQLEYVARQMVVNAFYKENGENISSIKRGDTQITYTETISREDMTQEHRDLCCKYRRIRIG